jgi:glucokinase
MILAADVGGTHIRLALVDVQGTRLVPAAEGRLSSGSHRTLTSAVKQFLAEHEGRPTIACLGIAGPVIGARVATPNLPWVIDAGDLRRDLGLDQVWLINDLEAHAYGLEILDDDDFAILNTGDPNCIGNVGVIAAGTGLGEAGLYWDGRRHWPFACEGGHADFAPRDAREADLLRYLLGRFERVSYERVLSGRGLQNIYRYLRDTRGAREPVWLTDRMREQDANAAIANAGLDGTCELCVEALDMFVSVYGAEAGNLALKLMATGGVFVGGGIAPQIIEKLKDGCFMNAFVAKGRLAPLMRSMRVQVVLNDRVALLGAARYAAGRAAPNQERSMAGIAFRRPARMNESPRVEGRGSHPH